MSPAWILPILIRNLLLVVVVMGFWNHLLYVWKRQGTRFKYNRRWPDKRNPSFFLQSQLLDNLFYTFVWSVPIMTLCEVAGLWIQANGWSPTVSWQDHPVYLTFLVLMIPALHMIHFHFLHWSIHSGPLYRWIHSVHHRNINPGPWSALSAHPIETLATFASIWPFLLVPSHGLIIITAILYNFSLASEAHLGFGKVELGKDGQPTLDTTDNYYHYLHHRYHECNYSGSVLDLWFGTWHDGTVAAHEKMKSRLKRLVVHR